MDTTVPAEFAGVDWEQLWTRGWVIVPGFCSPAECAEIMQHYNSTPITQSTINAYKIPWAPESVQQRLRDVLLPGVRKGTGSPVDHVGLAETYATKQDGQDNLMPWHLDHGSYFHMGTHQHFYNVWVPALKGDRTKSGMKMVAFDTLRRVDPEYAETLTHRGAAHYWRRDNGEFIECDKMKPPWTRYRVIPDFEEVGECPEVGAGDALIMRMDIPHRTQVGALAPQHTDMGW